MPKILNLINSGPFNWTNPFEGFGEKLFLDYWMNYKRVWFFDRARTDN